jgi:hypothetical protein
MSLRQFINGYSELHFEGVFLSPRIVKEALEKRFKLVTIEESAHHVQFKIVRLFRLYGGPAFFPQARVDITIHKKDSRSSLCWYFVWPEYYVFLVSFIILFAMVILYDGIQRTPFLIFPLIFFGFMVFLDTKWVSRRVRLVFERLLRAST